MATPQQKLDLLVKAYRSLSSVQWGPRTVKGYLPPVNEEVSSLLSELDAEDLIEVTANINGLNVLVSDINYESYPGASVEVELAIDQGPNTPFVRTFSDLLNLHGALHKRPAVFFVDEPRYYSEDSIEPPEIIQKYFSTISFIKVLKGIADFVDETDPRFLRLIYLLKEKYEIKVVYDAGDVEMLSTSDTLIDFTQNSPHEINKRDILKSVVIDLIKSSDTPFKTLLRSIHEISRRATDNYAIFVSEFSFEKIRDEIEKRKSEFIIRINRTFADIQDKLLGIPIALIIAATQIDIKNGYTKNTAIITGISIFTILMGMLINNQLHNLEAIKDEYDYQREMLKKEYSSLHAKIASAFDTINARWKRLKYTFYFLSLIMILNYIISYVLYYKWTMKFKKAAIFLWNTF